MNQENTNRLEGRISTKSSDLLKGFIKKIPKIWKAKRGAKKLLKLMPKFQEELKFPTSELKIQSNLKNHSFLIKEPSKY